MIRSGTLRWLLHVVFAITMIACASICGAGDARSAPIEGAAVESGASPASLALPHSRQWRARTADLESYAVEAALDDDDGDDDIDGERHPRAHVEDSTASLRGTRRRAVRVRRPRIDPEIDPSRFTISVGLARGPPV
jgi:hypothetical protein